MATSFETKLTAAAAVFFAAATTVAAMALTCGDPEAINGVIGAGFGSVFTGASSFFLHRLDREYGPS
ncbi:hypothetical protein AB0L80_42865 [Streptomyces sp. NPDC052069]|uniref:hypothetical protein n=1 Tax=Streptomyces sp. NPDC052069 TaxID=3154650 RepID=UPI00343222AF